MPLASNNWMNIVRDSVTYEVTPLYSVNSAEGGVVSLPPVYWISIFGNSVFVLQ